MNRGWIKIVIMAGHSRSKNGVASLAYGPGHPRLRIYNPFKTWMPGIKPGMTDHVECIVLFNVDAISSDAAGHPPAATT
jgi:hypothetical protein